MLGVAPVARALLQHISLATTTSRNDPWAMEMWWNWYGSWIFFGGPLGRWIWGTIYGFYVLRATHSNPDRGFLGKVIELPYIRIVVVAALGMIISIFCLALVFMTTRTILQGTTTIQSLKSSCRSENSEISFVCIPGQLEYMKTSNPLRGYDSEVHSKLNTDIYPALPGERIYNLGSRTNWDIFLKTPIRIPKTSRREYIWPKLNPSVLRRMRNANSTGSHGV